METRRTGGALGEAGHHAAVEPTSSGQGSACWGTCPLRDPLGSPSSGTGLTQPRPNTSMALAAPQKVSIPTGHAQVSPLDRHWALGHLRPHKSQEAGTSLASVSAPWSDGTQVPPPPCLPWVSPRRAGSQEAAPQPAGPPGLRSYRLSSPGVTQSAPGQHAPL